MALLKNQEECDICKENQSKLEGYLLRKVEVKNKLKKLWFSLLGKELYCYRSKRDVRHRNLYILAGVYIVKEPKEMFMDELELFPFTLVFPHRKRTFHSTSEEERDNWVKTLKEAIGYTDFFDFYEIKDTLGNGKFGIVKKAIHKKTG